jgi:hypothetical protein
MGRLSFQSDVNERLQGKPYLQPVFSGGCYDITRRIREQDPSYFIVWNLRKQRYEVHTLNNKGNTFAFVVPNNRLDARVEDEIRRCNFYVRGMDIFREMDEHNQKLVASIERQRHNDLMGIAEEMYPYFRTFRWEGSH